MYKSPKQPDKWQECTCQYCDTKFLTYVRLVNKGYGKFCSKNCRIDFIVKNKKQKLSVRNSLKIKRYIRLTLDAHIIEHFVNNPNKSLKEIGKKFGVDLKLVSISVTKYFAKPKCDMLINSGIDTPRAIDLESKLILKNSTEVYEFIDGW